MNPFICENCGQEIKDNEKYILWKDEIITHKKCPVELGLFIEEKKKLFLDFHNFNRLWIWTKDNPEIIWKHFEQCLTEAYQKGVRGVVMSDRPYDLFTILEKLSEAADILLHKKDYDGHGWEEMQQALDYAKNFILQLEQKLKG